MSEAFTELLERLGNGEVDTVTGCHTGGRGVQRGVDDRRGGSRGGRRSGMGLVPLSDLHDYLIATFGNTVGNAHIAVGADQYLNGQGKYAHGTWRESFFAWRRESAELIRAIEQASPTGADVYVTRT